MFPSEMFCVYSLGAFLKSLVTHLTITSVFEQKQCVSSGTIGTIHFLRKVNAAVMLGLGAYFVRGIKKMLSHHCYFLVQVKEAYNFGGCLLPTLKQFVTNLFLLENSWI